jgi:Protein of unknown function (DUF982)
MDRPFDQPLRLGNGTRVLVIASVMEAAGFLVEEWPRKKRRLPSYRTAMRACVLALGGRAEPATCVGGKDVGFCSDQGALFTERT